MDPSLQNFAQTNYEIGESLMCKSRNPSHIQLHKSIKRNLLHTRTQWGKYQVGLTPPNLYIITTLPPTLFEHLTDDGDA